MGLSITFQSINHSLMGNSQLEYHNTRTKCILFPLNLLFLKLSCIVEVNTYISCKLLKNITWSPSRLNIRNCGMTLFQFHWRPEQSHSSLLELVQKRAILFSRLKHLRIQRFISSEHRCDKAECGTLNYSL